jgi:hypothetical protein
MTDNNKGRGAGALFGKLLLPAYTDAGASTTFLKPISSFSRDGGGGEQEESFDDAETEIHDNRSSQIKQSSIHVMEQLQQQQQQQEQAPLPNLLLDDESAVDGKFGFFRSTKPANKTFTNPPNRLLVDGDNQEQEQQQVLPEESPLPQSPPLVERRQLLPMVKVAVPAPRSVATTSVIPEIGISSSLVAAYPPDFAAAYPPNNLEPSPCWEQGSENVSTTVSSGVLGYRFLSSSASGDDSQAFEQAKVQAEPAKLASLRPIEPEQSILATGTAKQKSLKTDAMNGGDDSLSTSTNSALNNSLMDDDDDIMSDVMSNVDSTASEYGTVVNIAGARARMEEVEAMARLIEESPSYESHQGSQRSNSKIIRRPQQDETLEPVVQGLCLPFLDGRPFEPIPLNYESATARVPSPPPKSSLLQQTQSKQSASQSASLEDSGIDTTAGGASASASVSASASASAMLSATIRRIGSGLSSKKSSPTLSAPPTPGTPRVPRSPRVEELFHSTRSPKQQQQPQHEFSRNPPASFGSRSPGSAARVSLTEAHDSSPRFPGKVRREREQSIYRTATFPQTKSQTLPAGTRDYTKTSITPTPRMDNSKVGLPGPFWFAQKCFSFDSTLADDYYPAERTTTAFTVPNSSQRQRGDEYSSLPVQSLQSQSNNVSHNNHNNRRSLQQSMSWDVGGVQSRIKLRPRTQPTAFRTNTDDSHRYGGHHSRSGLFQSNSHDVTAQQQRARMNSDFSPSKTNAVELQTPQVRGHKCFAEVWFVEYFQEGCHSPWSVFLSLQRIEIEREDALDILACLVERGVALHQEGGKYSSDSKEKQIFRESSNCQDSASDPSSIRKDSNRNMEAASDTSDSYVTNVVEELRLISKEQEGRNSHSTRMAALDELLRSHSYALEMKRAALSASVWLKSIGRSDREEGPDEVDSTGGQATGEGDRSEVSSTSDKVELTTLKALLRTAQMEAKDKAEAAKKLDAELSKCRAEIGRLKSESRAEVRQEEMDSFG